MSRSPLAAAAAHGRRHPTAPPQLGHVPSATEPVSPFWEWLERMLSARAVPRTHLAERLGLTRGALSNWRHGRSMPAVENCRQLAELLQLPLLVVLYHAGHLRASDLMLSALPLGGQQVQLRDGTGAAGTLTALPVPEQELGRERLRQATVAISTLGLPKDAEWNIIALLETHYAASQLAAQLRAGPGSAGSPPSPATVSGSAI